MKKFSNMLVLAALVLMAGSISGQHLRRRANFGFQPIPVNDSIAQARQLKTTTGILVGRVFPHTTFANMGVEAGDVVLSLNDVEMSGFPALQQVGDGMVDGDPMTATVWRKGKAKKLRGKAVARAMEPSTDQYEVIYGETPFDGGYLRTIVNRPRRPGPHPTLYFIPGYTCASVDALSPLHPYRKLVDSLAGLDYLIFRVEKPGVGDGPHPCQCAETGFNKELEVFSAGYDALLRTEGVDKDRIFVFGHSMGGVQAPVLAAKGDIEPLGIAVYGTVFQSWYEYILAMLRFQQPRVGDDYLELEDKMQEYTKLFYEHYVLQKPLSEIIRNPEWKAMLERDFALDDDGNILFRRAFYWREISQHNLTRAWAKTRAHVLSIYGEADFEVFNEFSMSEIARIVNAYHPGHGSFVSLPGTDHSFIHVGSMEKEAELKGSPAYRDYLVKHFDWGIVTTLHEWMQNVMEKSGS
jgi:pimeloyl-ACP methyl ester carboxylesterase